MNIQNLNSGNLIAYTTAGVPVQPDRNNATVANRGLTLGVATYYIPLDVTDEGLLHIKLRWSASLAATITVESTSLPAGAENGVADVVDWSTNPGDWDTEAPASAVVSAVTGGTATGLSIATTAAGGVGIHLSNMGARRLRLKVIVATGGILRAANNGKRESEG